MSDRFFFSAIVLLLLTAFGVWGFLHESNSLMCRARWADSGILASYSFTAGFRVKVGEYWVPEVNYVVNLEDV